MVKCRSYTQAAESAPWVQGHIEPELRCSVRQNRDEFTLFFYLFLRRLLSPSQRVEGSLNEKRQQKHGADESMRRSLVFFHVSKEDIWTAMRARQRGSGSGEAAHPSPSLRIRTICTGALERVILSMQSRCHAVSVCYTSAESANLHPHRFTKKKKPHAHTVRLVDWHIYLKYGPWRYHSRHYGPNLRERWQTLFILSQ